MLTFIVVAAVVLVGLVVLVKRGSAPVTAPLVVNQPKLGFLNLSGSKYDSLMEGDKKALQNSFHSAEIKSLEECSGCDVLFIYGDIGDDGKFGTQSKSLREIIRDSNASIVVVASENNVEKYIQAAKDVGYGRANLVMTLERNGDSFQGFFQKLFQRMGQGIFMPLAWVESAPQGGPAGGGADTPGTIFSAELGQVTFQNSPMHH